MFIFILTFVIEFEVLYNVKIYFLYRCDFILNIHDMIYDMCYDNVHRQWLFNFCHFVFW